MVAFSFVLWGEFSDTICQDPCIQSLGGASQHAAQPQRNSEGLGNETEHRGPGRTHVEQPGHVRCPGGCLPVTAASPVVLQSPWPANKVFQLFFHGNQARPLLGYMAGLWHSPFSSLETSTGWAALKAGIQGSGRKQLNAGNCRLFPFSFTTRHLLSHGQWAGRGRECAGMNGEWISKLCVNVQESKREKELCTNR